MKKFISIILSSLLMLSICFVAGCFPTNSGPVYSTEYVSNDTHHWRPLIDGDADDPLYVDYGAHVNKKGMCECGFYYRCPYLTYGLNNAGTGLICYGAANPDGYSKETFADSEGTWSVASPENNWLHVEVPAYEVYNGKTYPVVELYAYAFKYDAIETLKLNEGLLSIGSQAFGYMAKIKEVVIPNSVNNVGGSLFYYNTSIERVIIGNSVPAINNYNFYNCEKLRYVKIGSSVSHLGIVAFNGCDSLEYVVLPISIKTMSQDGPSPLSKYGPFSGCNTACKIYFEHATLPSGVPSEWNPNGLYFYFAGQWQYDANGVPYPTV